MTGKVTMAAATAGHAEGGTTLNAFDNALLAAGIGNINLIKVSSILPPEVPVIDLPKIKLGALVPTAYAAMTSETPGEIIAAAVLYGIPFEGRVNLRKGADGGPRDLRLASDSIETYSPFLDRDMEDLPLADIGDCELPDGAPPREQLDAARDEIRAWWRPGLIPFMLGGDHTATVSVVEAIAPAFPDLRIVQLDAHPDLREEFLGERYNYASAMARVMDTVPAERVYQVGIRTGAREEYARHRPRFYPAFAVHPLDAVRTILPELRGHPLYVTIDVDVLDPAEAPR